MTRNTVITAQPNMLKWARETMGMSVSDVARALKRPEHDIESWESGLSSPTYSQLETLAYKVFKRPLALFFLPSPPQEIAPKQEFRTLPDTDLDTLPKDTVLHIRKAHAFQLTLKEVFGHTNPATSHIWKSLKLSLQAPIQVQALKVRNYLGVSLEDQISWKNSEVALKQWRQSVESVGIFVFKAPFKQRDISGFCLLHDVFPVIYLNNSTTKTRQLFSLMHELAHVLLDINGISKTDDTYINRLPHETKKIEQFCNAFAAEILIPQADFQSQTAGLSQHLDHSSDTVFADMASRYGVSREAILRKFLDEGWVSQALYSCKSDEWNNQKKSSSGGNYYASQNTYLSERFSREVVRQHYLNQITVDVAADFLGIKAKSFAGLEQRILRQLPV